MTELIDGRSPEAGQLPEVNTGRLGVPRITLATRRPYSWKTLLFLVILIVPASFAILPFALTLTGQQVAGDQMGVLIAQTGVSILVYSLMAAFGLFLAARIGLGLPYVEGWLEKIPVGIRFRRVLFFGALLGVLVGILILLLDGLVFSPRVTALLETPDGAIPENIRPPAWQGLLAAFSAGVTEEVIFRLFGMTTLAWLGGLVFHDGQGRPHPAVIWIANILIAVGFGLSHLPATAAIGLPLDAFIIGRAILLNGIVGVGFGWLYWRMGLESAMVAHFSTDVVLHVLTAMVVSLAAG